VLRSSLVLAATGIRVAGQRASGEHSRQLIYVLRGDMSIVLVRQTDAVGAIRDRAPFETSRHIAAEWPLTPIIWKVSLSQIRLMCIL
jgi:hypothetical protein